MLIFIDARCPAKREQALQCTMQRERQLKCVEVQWKVHEHAAANQWRRAASSNPLCFSPPACLSLCWIRESFNLSFYPFFLLSLWFPLCPPLTPPTHPLSISPSSSLSPSITCFTLVPFVQPFPPTLGPLFPSLQHHKPSHPPPLSLDFSALWINVMSLFWNSAEALVRGHFNAFYQIPFKSFLDSLYLKSSFKEICCRFEQSTYKEGLYILLLANGLIFHIEALQIIIFL